MNSVSCLKIEAQRVPILNSPHGLLANTLRLRSNRGTQGVPIKKTGNFILPVPCNNSRDTGGSYPNHSDLPPVPLEIIGAKKVPINTVMSTFRP